MNVQCTRRAVSLRWQWSWCQPTLKYLCDGQWVSGNPVRGHVFLLLYMIVVVLKLTKNISIVLL